MLQRWLRDSGAVPAQAYAQLGEAWDGEYHAELLLDELEVNLGCLFDTVGETFGFANIPGGGVAEAEALMRCVHMLRERDVWMMEETRAPSSVSVADFGLSCLRPTGAFGGGKVTDGFGPWPWMAPEQFQPPHIASHASDAFSAGVLLWEIFSQEQASGRIPWHKERQGCDDDMRAALVRRIVEGARLTVPDTCPDAVKSIIEDCFEGDPLKRPTLDAIVERLGGVV